MDVVINGEPRRVPFETWFCGELPIVEPVIGPPPLGMQWVRYQYLESEVVHFVSAPDN